MRTTRRNAEFHRETFCQSQLRHPTQLLELASAAAVLPRPSTFLDIGANLGYYTLLFAQYGHDVLAVEPMAYNRNALAASLCLNPTLASRITLVAAALVRRLQAASPGVARLLKRSMGS